jgi:3-oxoacid CoA-transferase B subunit
MHIEHIDFPQSPWTIPEELYKTKIDHAVPLSAEAMEIISRRVGNRKTGYVFVGAMDLVAGVKRVIVVMEHANKHGQSKVLKSCTLPLTGKGCVDMAITDLCVFAVDRKGGGMTLTELAPGITLSEVKARTEATFDPGRFA